MKKIEFSKEKCKNWPLDPRKQRKNTQGEKQCMWLSVCDIDL